MFKPLITVKNFALFFLALCVLGQTAADVFAQYQVRSWTTDDGLPQNSIYSIVQTRDGYLWMATLDGLVRFDGVKFTVFNKNNSAGIAGNRFVRVIEDAAGDLWIVTEDSGIIRFHDGVFRTFPIVETASNSPIRNVVLNPAGKIVVLIGANLFEWNGEDFAAIAPISGITADSQIFWNRAGAFFSITGQILTRIENGRVSQFTLPGKNQEVVRNPFYEDRRGTLWIGTLSAGLLKFADDRLTALTEKDGLPAGIIIPKIEDRAGNLWATSEGGAVIVSPSGKISRLTTENGLSDNLLSAIYEDREGNIWLGTLYHGLNRASRRAAAFYTMRDGLAANVVHPIFEDQTGDIWLGGAGLTRFHDNQFKRASDETKLFSGVATAIAQDRTGRLWFGFWNGAYYLENGVFKEFSEKLGLTAPAIFDIHEDANGAIWFASGAGLLRYQNDVVTRLTTADGLISDNTKVIHESADGTLWIGTSGGLTRIEREKRRRGEGEKETSADNSSSPLLPFSLSSFTAADGLGGNQIRTIYEDADGAIWIGTYDSGLTRFKDGKFTVYNSRNGLYNDGVFQILEDANQNFWMSSNRGIYRVSKAQLNNFADGKIARIESIAYGKADGLLETECNGGQQPAGIKTRDGKLWFPTQNGVAVIDPQSITINPYAPPIAIESIKVDNETVNFADSMTVAAGKNNLEISYTGLSFVKPELVGFRYKLAGQDADWVEAGTRRTAYYSYLPPGEYTFQVIAANSDGVWNTDGKSLKILIESPFYRTWWFSVLSLAIIFSAIYLLYRQRINRLEAERRTQEKFSRDLLASQESERQRIAAELHDGLGQSLLVIKNRALLGTMSPEDANENQEQFEEISRASSQAIEEVREIAYNLRPYHLDRLGLTQSIKAMLEAINDSTAIEFAFDIAPLENVFPKDEEVIVYRIVQESVNNILKHSEATEASVLIHPAANGLTITIEDNGRGFTPNSNKNGKGGFGLIGLDERVRILGGTLQIRSEPDNGTTIIIKELGNAGK